MQKALISLVSIIFFAACSQKNNDSVVDQGETEQQEEQAHKLAKPFANGKILELDKTAGNIVAGIQGKLWSRSSNLNSTEKDKEKKWVMEINPANLKINSYSSGNYDLHYQSVLSDGTSINEITVLLARTSGNIWVAEKGDVGLNFRITCLPMGSISDCSPKLSSVIEIISVKSKWSSGKPMAVGFLYGETQATTTFSGGLITEFGNQSMATLRSVSILNPVEVSSFASLDIESNKGLLVFRAKHDSKSVGGMMWSMDSESKNSPLYGYSFPGGSDTLSEYDAESVVTLPIYASQLDFSRSQVLDDKVVVTLKRRLIAPNVEK